MRKKIFLLFLLCLGCYISVFAEEPRLTVAKYYDGTYCFINETGDVKITGDYLEAYPFSDGLARVQIKENDELKYVFLDETGKIVINPPRIKEIEGTVFRYEILNDFSEGLAPIYLKEKRSKTLKGDDLDDYEYYKTYITTNGEVSPTIRLSDRTTLNQFHDGIARIEMKEGTGFIDKTGKWIFEAKLKDAADFSEGYARIIFKNTSKIGFIDRDGKIAIKPIFVVADDFSEGLFLGKDDSGNMGYFDATGTLVINIMDLVSHYQTYSNLKEMVHFTNKFESAVKDDEKFGISLPQIGPFQNGVAPIILVWNSNRSLLFPSKSSTLIFINKKGYVIYYRPSMEDKAVTMEYSAYSDGIYWLYTSGTPEYHCIDSTGKDIFESYEFSPIYKMIDFKEQNVSFFRNGLAQVKDSKGNICYINKKGEVVYKE